MANDMQDGDVQTGARLYKHHARQRDRFLVGSAAILVAPLFAGRYLLAGFDAGAFPAWVPLSAGIVGVIGFCVFTWAFYVRYCDEVELQMNFAAHTIAFYVTIAAFWIWGGMARLSLAPAPSAIGIVVIMLCSLFAVFGVLKLRERLPVGQ